MSTITLEIQPSAVLRGTWLNCVDIVGKDPNDKRSWFITDEVMDSLGCTTIEEAITKHGFKTIVLLSELMTDWGSNLYRHGEERFTYFISLPRSRKYIDVVY